MQPDQLIKLSAMQQRSERFPVKQLRLVVTGASRGIGRAIALECARRGAVVGANYCKSKEAAESLQAAAPDKIRLLQFDVRDFDAVQAAFARFVDLEGPIDALVNNAGIGARPQFLVKGHQLLIDEIVAINLLGTIYCTRAALQSMMKARAGQIINISSIAANSAMGGVTVYAATKGAVESLAATVAKEYARRGIRANSLRFGLVRTDMTKDLIAASASCNDSDAGLLFRQPEEIGTVVADILFGVTPFESGTTVTLPEPPRMFAERSLRATDATISIGTTFCTTSRDRERAHL